jgi:8-oxo-dGTP diphosphatase
MTHYTIGIYFNSSFEKVVLMLKNRPEWQRGKYNFPGGHVETGETGFECVSREFKEECGVTIPVEDWKHIATMFNMSSYVVDIYTAIEYLTHGTIKTMEDQPVSWCEINNLPYNVISNIPWITRFAKNYWSQGNADNLHFGWFQYEDLQYS